MHPLDLAPFWPRLMSGAAAAGVTWLVAYDAGTAVVRRWIDPEVLPEVGAALGYAIVGTVIGILGLLHALDVRVIAALLLVAILVRAPSHVKRLRGLLPALTHRQQSTGALTMCASIVSMLALLVALCAAALPAVWWDPIAYHLPLTALALSRHTLSFDPLFAQTGFPLLAESAAIPAYALAGSAGAAMSTLGAGIVLALLCGRLADSIAPGGRALGTMLIATSALVLWLAPSFYVDIPFALFALAALSIPLVAGVGGLTPRLSMLSGALAGAAAATKYPGLLVALLALCAVLWSAPKRVAQFGWFAGGFVAVALGWYARTFLLTGDPVFPFVTVIRTHVQNPQLYAGAQRFCGGGTGLVDLALLPWRMLTDPKMFCGDPGYALRLGSVLVLAAIVTTARARAWLWIAAAITGLWFFTAQQWRLLVDAVVICGVVAAAAGASIVGRARALVGWILVALSFVGVLTQVAPWAIADASNSLVPGYPYMLGRETAGDYLRRRLETYAAAEWLAQHDPSAKVFALDDVRDYYFGDHVLWGNSPYPGGFRLDWTQTPSRRYMALEALGYRYMVVNDNPAYTHRTTADVDWTALEADERSGAVRKVFEQNDVAVYSLR